MACHRMGIEDGGELYRIVLLQSAREHFAMLNWLANWGRCASSLNGSSHATREAYHDNLLIEHH